MESHTLDGIFPVCLRHPGQSGGGSICFACTEKNFRFGAAGFDTAFVIAAALLAYGLAVLIGGNGYLSVYIVGIILGNSRIKK